MPARSGQRATYEDLLAVPDHLLAEILDGELYTTPRPAARHARAASRLGMDLGPFDLEGGGGSDVPGGWWILFEPELHLGQDVLVPDLAGWRRERMPVVPDVAFFEMAPDWVCEVVSPGTETVDRGSKRDIYAREGVSHLWLLNPVTRTLEVFKLSGTTWALLHTFVGERTVRAEPFDAVLLEMSRWWLPPRT